MVLHRERVNEVFGKRSARLLDLFLIFIDFVIMARLPLRRVGATRHRKQRQVVDRRRLIYPTPIVTKKETYDLLS